MTYDFDYVYLSKIWSNEYTEGFTLKWSAKNTKDIGFGEFTFRMVGGKTTCETECMNKDFIEQAVKFWLENVKYEDV